MHSSTASSQGPLPPSSFYDLDYSFSGFLPFKFYPFMCELQPFYFDEQQPKLNHWIKELYRFRAYAIDFSIERNQGLPSILFYLGLKQSLKTTDFFLLPKNYFFRKVSFSREYAYLLSSSWFSKGPLSMKNPFLKDWFYKKVESHQFSIFFWESLFQKYQRRFWRLRLKGWWNRHLRLESSFFLSALHSAGSLETDLPFNGDGSSSYHFSFLSDSLDRRGLALSPVKFFYFKYRRLLSSNLYKFSLRANFQRQWPQPSLLFLSSFVWYINFCLENTLLFLFHYSLLLFPSFSPRLDLRTSLDFPLGLSLTSSLHFYRRSRYYFLPKGFLFEQSRGIYFRNQVSLYLRLHLLTLYKPSSVPQKAPRLSSLLLTRSRRRLSLPLQRRLLTLRRPWYRKKRDKSPLLHRLWHTRLLKLRLIHRLRWKLWHLVVSTLRRPGINFFSSSKEKKLFLRKLRFAWKAFILRRSFFRFRWRPFLGKALWKPWKLKRLRLFPQWQRLLEPLSQGRPSVIALDVKFFLRKLFLLFLSLHKSSFFLPLENPFPSFLRSLQRYLRAQRSFFPYLKARRSASLLRKLKLLELYRGKLLSAWKLRWGYFLKRFVLLHRTTARSTFSLHRRSVFFFYRMLRLRRRLWNALSRLSRLAHRLRRRSLYHSYSFTWEKRKRFSLKRSLRKSLLPTLYLLKRKVLFKRKSSLARFWRWGYRKTKRSYRHSFHKALRKRRAHLRKLKRHLKNLAKVLRKPWPKVPLKEQKAFFQGWRKNLHHLKKIPPSSWGRTLNRLGRLLLRRRRQRLIFKKKLAFKPKPSKKISKPLKKRSPMLRKLRKALTSPRRSQAFFAKNKNLRFKSPE